MPLRRRIILGCVLSVFAAAGAAGQTAPPPSLTASQLEQNARAYLAAPAALRDQRNEFPQEDAVQLYHLRYEQVVPSGLSALLVQRVFQIRTRAGAELFAPDDLWYDRARGRFQLLRAEVWRRPGEQGRYRVVGQGKDLGDLAGFALGTQPRRVGLPRLRVGDRVSVLYALLPDTGRGWSLLEGHFIGNMYALRDSFATERVRYVLAAHQPMAVSAVGLPAPQRGSGREGLRTWRWEADDLPAFFQSAGGPAITEVSPFVQVSSFTTWTAMARWYGALLAKRAQVSPALAADLRRIAGGPAAATRAEAQAAVARVWQYLAAHLSYRGVEEGVHAYVPAPVGEVFRSGQGDCKDGALLLVTWLRILGVQADLALVRTPAMGPLAPANAEGQVAATMAAFDHALVYIPATGQWLDTTAPHHPEGDLPQGDQNSVALIVRQDQSRLVRVEDAPAVAAAGGATRVAAAHSLQP